MQLQPAEPTATPGLPSGMTDPDPTSGISPKAQETAARVLDDGECLALLADRRWGVLSVVEATAARPYAVPVSYAFDGEAIYIAIDDDGRKLRALERNPALCLTVMEVACVDRWKSVVVIGSARWLKESDQRARAIRAFAAQLRSPDRGALSSAAAARLVVSRMLSIQVEQMSGRALGKEAESTRREARESAALGESDVVEADRAAPAQSRESQATADVEKERRHTAHAAMDALRRVVRALRTSNAATEEKYRLSAAQLFMLSQIALQPKQSLSDVARRTLTSQSSASEVIAKLVRRGLVSRRVSVSDRRRIEFSLTEDGTHLLDLAPDTVPERLVAGFLALTPEQQEGLARGLDAWMVSARLRDVPATMFMEEERRA